MNGKIGGEGRVPETKWKTKGSKGAKGKRPRSVSKTREVRNTGLAKGVNTITNDMGQTIIIEPLTTEWGNAYEVTRRGPRRQ